ncbi:rod shape-determining protein, partial [bacterium]|nr:rod shape-determining protein [bacterium]
GLKILAARVLEHPDRAMLDGQVHKMEAVAAVVARIKTELEEITGLSFAEAAVAAAGRALLTEFSVQTRRFSYPTVITHDEIRDLELSAARTAQSSVRAMGNQKELHCVGFSPVRYFLDQEALVSLEGHCGREISVEMLTTFLPRQVVNSLMTVLRRAGLTARTLTLEPIAAMEAVIPADLRRMNLALVDVGAGTSDIAITREGSVCAYAMVTQAGDEITEDLCDHYLLDFVEAERIKRSIETAGKEPLEFTTIFGQGRNLPAGEILQTLLPGIRRLAKEIADSIRRLNSSVPRAIVMVGGGSATPRLGELLAEELGLEPGRVGIRGPETILDLKNATGVLIGIEGVTPLGIALTSLRGKGLRFINAEVNGQSVQMLGLTGLPTVFDALLSAGCELKSLHARPGKAMTYTLAGKLMTLPGTSGAPGRITVNGSPASLDTSLQSGSKVEMMEARHGKDAVLLPKKIPRPSEPAGCLINDRHYDLELVLLHQGLMVEEESILPDRAKLEWVSKHTLAELVPELNMDYPANSDFTIRINGQSQSFQGKRMTIKVNNYTVDANYRARANDRIEWCGHNSADFC